jgi:uncharacterized protein YhaN
MRLARLDLTRYGKFTDHRVDFGAKAPGRPDLHIIYGPNEAGKSTALAAILDLLFGVETQSRYGFLHPYPTMRIGAALELDGGIREIARVKRAQNSLLDGAGQPISDGFLLRELGGIDRETYRTMFSLDDETLEAGGKSILASKGDLGQLLFSASAGLADLSQTLSDLQTEAEDFYRLRARSGKLIDLKSRLASLKASRDEIDTLASVYAQLIDGRDRASTQYDEAIGESRETRARIDAIQRQLNALPRLTALREIRRDLAPLADLPEAPAAWADELPQLQRAETELATRQDGVAADIDRLSREIAAIARDEAALAIADRVDRLTDSQARYVTADKDLPERRLQGKEANLEIAGILRRLERDSEADPRSLLLGASAVGALRALIEKRSGVEAALETTQSELSEAAQRLAEARAELAAAGGDSSAEQEAGPSAIALAVALAAARAGDHGARRRVAEKARPALLEALADRMAALKPWTGDFQELAAIAAPEPAELEAWSAALAETQKQIERHTAEVGRLTSEQRSLDAQAKAIGEAVGPADDRRGAAIRAARDEAWASHRRQFDAASADSFEAALRQDDSATEARLRHASDVAKLQQIRQALAIVEADLAGARESLAARGAEQAALRQRIGAAIAAMAPSLPGDLSVSQLKTWLDRRDKALEAAANLRKIERDLREAAIDAHSARDRIGAALTAAGAPPGSDDSLEILMAIAQATIDRESRLKTLRAQAEARRREMNKRQADCAAATEAEQKWAAAWRAACARSWIGENGAERDIATVREILTEIGALGPAIDRQASLADRIQKMELDQQAFRQEVEAIASQLGGASGADDILGGAHEIAARVAQARGGKARRATKARELEDLEARGQAVATAIEAQHKRKAEMTGLFAVASLAEVGGKLRQSETKATLGKSQIGAEREILDALGLASLEEAEALLDGIDRAALESELGDLKARIDDQERRTHELFAARSNAQDRLEAVGGDDAVARIEQERRTVLLEIEEKAARYFRLRVGIVAAEQALRLYRDRHRSAMMMRASESFRTISRGAYVGLATQPDKNAEILIGVGRDGSSKVASDMSKGTRFQLYLALRVAGYEEFASARPAVPFIADDIMETFDDFRAEEAFRLFAEMAEVGQVIYLTHHRHLCDIAARACPGARVHELPTP